jgi:hypothetical protein
MAHGGVMEEDYNKGGMCYAEGGTMHPLDAMMRDKFLAKKMAYGGPVENEDMAAKDYDEYAENNRDMEIANEELSGDTNTQAPDEDKDRLAFMRSFMAHRAVRRR